MTSFTVDPASLKAVVLNYVGNKNNGEALHLAKAPLELEEDAMTALQDGFLHKFRSIPEIFSFHHETSLDYHEVYQFCKNLFEGRSTITEASAAIAQQLYQASTHPRVRGGEFYVAYFEGIPLESRMHKGVGLFKTENKSLFMDVEKTQGDLALLVREGVALSRIDKGCLILDTDAEGYDVRIFDNQNRGEEAVYWKDNFLGLVPRKNEFHQTQHFLSLTKQFITEQLPGELKVPRTEQVELLNRSIDYFKSKDSFDIDEFQQEVFADEEIIGSFRQFGSRYTAATELDIAAQFEISNEAVKKQARIYKSVVKLDKNFHIYIHGRTDLIQKGVDTDGRKFYKIYYQEEA